MARQPSETVPEKRFVDALARLRGKTVKGLRYDLQTDQPIANALLQNSDEPIALFVVPAGADEALEVSLQDMIANRPEMGEWTWRIGEEEISALPWLCGISNFHQCRESIAGNRFRQCIGQGRCCLGP
ncbi:hypothetical protein X743_27295 [Mesorhizobium sp. LNHC252B00]|nr:hypothetical protein X743_27295 [Mesorhizobium sp. LNHC252B00]